MKKDWKRFLKEVEAAGCEIETTNGGHVRIKTPTEGLVFAPSTPSDYRSLANIRSVLRRKGVAI